MNAKITTIAFIISGILAAQPPVLVKPNISGIELYSYDGNAYFAENDYMNSIYRPWMSDGTNAGTIKLSNSLNDAKGFTKAGNYVYFSADTLADGELYKTDGTPSGTFSVKNINASTTGVAFLDYPAALEFNSKLAFTADDGIVGQGLWVTDGTSNGTARIKKQASLHGAFANHYQKTNNKLVYLTNTGASTVGVRSYDGTTDTSLLGSMDYPAASANIFNPLQIGGYAYYTFEASNPQQVHVLKTDGTTLYDVAFLPPGTKEFVATSNEIYFQMYNSATGAELYKSDLNLTNITLVKDINAGAASCYVSSLMVMNGIVYFEANDLINGAELWRSDGTALGTYMVKDINPGSASSLGQGGFSHMPPLFVFCNKLYFIADDGTFGPELWSSDGTTSGTNMVLDFNSGSAGSQISELNVSNGRMYFFAFNGTTSDLWKIDGCFVPASVESIESEKNNVTVYPNPSHENLFIQSSEKIKSIYCTNYLGQKENVIFENSSINISSLTEGIYFLNIKTQSGKMETKKFIKQ